MPKISVIIPVYNVEKYLRQCLDSLVNQTFKDIEVICVDDCSTDGSFKILQEYAQKDSPFVVLKQETNKGVSIARNAGLNTAKGEYIMFVDSDDWLDLKCCEILLNNINSYTDIACFGINNFRNNVLTPRNDIKIIAEYKNSKTLPSEVLKNLAINACGKLFKKDFLTKYNIKFPQNIKTCEDGLFCLFCFYKEPNIKLVDSCLYNYRRGRIGSACMLKDNIVKTDIEAFKYILATEDFKQAKEEYKILTIEKFFQHFEWNYTDKYRYKNFLRIIMFKRYLFRNISRSLLKKCNLSRFKKYNFTNFLLKLIFSLKNSADKRHKLVTILGIKIALKRKMREI